MHAETWLRRRQHIAIAHDARAAPQLRMERSGCRGELENGGVRRREAGMNILHLCDTGAPRMGRDALAALIKEARNLQELAQSAGPGGIRLGNGERVEVGVLLELSE